MAVEMDGFIYRLLQSLDQLIGVIRRQKSGHIFYAYAVRPHFFQFFSFFDVVVDIIHLPSHPSLGHAVTYTALKMLSAFLYDGSDRLEISVIVQGVERSEYVHPVFGRSIHKGFCNIIGVVTVSDQILGP